MKNKDKKDNSKLNKVIKAINNPPPERMAKVNMESHALSALGTLIVCVILIFSGYWWVILALIFSLGLNYTGFVQARNQYKQIMAIKNLGKGKMSEIDIAMEIEEEISPARKISRKIKHLFGVKIAWILMLAIVVAYWFLIDPANRNIWWKAVMPFLIILTYLFIYFKVIGGIANRIWKTKYQIKPY